MTSAAALRAMEILGTAQPPEVPEVADRPETYGEWLRQQDPETLSVDEQERLARERAWDHFYPHIAASLDSFIGTTVRLKKTRGTWHAECGPSESVTATAVSSREKRVAGGTRFYIRARFADRLLGLERVTGEAYLLRGEWIEPVPATSG